MELVRGQHNLRARHRGCVATIGNFDGVHRGHQTVLRRLQEQAREFGSVTTVVVFEPQPAEYFATSEPPARLTCLREKFLLLSRFGIDRMLLLKFDQKLASQRATQFVENVLIDGLGIKSLIVGDDFRFGTARTGDFQQLQGLAHRYAFQIARAESFMSEQERVSSTGIRALLKAGQVREVERLLGRKYFMAGRVVHGYKRGRTMGFPTANLDLHRKVSPLSGIFAVRVKGLAAETLPAIAYVGSRPIIDDPRYVLEVHIFDYDADCYGRYIEVEFVDKVRDDMSFDSFTALSAQIATDCDVARSLLAADSI